MTVEELRQSLHLSQAQFADRIGISHKSYNNKVNGRNSWTVPELIRIAEFGEIDITSDSSTLHCKISHNV